VQTITVVVVAHYQLFRDGLRALIEGSDGSSEGAKRSRIDTFAVVGEAAGVDEACAVIGELQPHAVIFDVELPSPPTRETVGRIHAIAPDTRILAIGAYRSRERKQRLFELGIAGYLSKESAAGELVSMLRRITRPRPGAVASQMPVITVAEAVSAISQRERAVLALAAQAMSNMQISRRLDISEATVKRHLHNVFRKLGAVSRMDAVRKAGLNGSR
jgi:DNA-binding NarL/FixJ family response regulator